MIFQDIIGDMEKDAVCMWKLDILMSMLHTKKNFPHFSSRITFQRSVNKGLSQELQLEHGIVYNYLK